MRVVYYLGASRQQFENFFRQRVASRVRRFPDPEREEDVVQALLFKYTLWPYKDDEIANRDQLGHVSVSFSSYLSLFFSEICKSIS